MTNPNVEWGKPSEFKEPLSYFMENKVARAAFRLIGPTAGVIIAGLSGNVDFGHAALVGGVIQESTTWAFATVKQIAPLFGAMPE